MGYLKQKKQTQAINNFLLLATILLSMLTFSSFSDHPFFVFINNYKLQIFAINALLLLFAIIRRKKRYILASLILFFINYSSISAYGNFINNTKINSQNKQSIVFIPQSSEILNINNSIVIINFSNTSDFEGALNQLQSFILAQNEPTIIIGDFKKPLWHPKLKEFMQKTGLKSKNKIIFNSFNPFYVPTINVLGFDNIGLDKIIKKNDRYEFILLAK